MICETHMGKLFFDDKTHESFHNKWYVLQDTSDGHRLGQSLKSNIFHKEY